MAVSLITCPGQITQYSYRGNVARCTEEWVLVDAQDVINEAVNSSYPDSSSMLIAFGAGLAVMVPLYAVLWGIRAARDSIKQS